MRSKPQVVLVTLMVAVFAVGASVSLAAGPPADEAQAETSGITPPRIIAETQKAPEYPPAALAARFTGVVKVDVQVLADGRVGDIDVTESTHKRVGFEEAVIEALRSWRFVPAHEDGLPRSYKTSYVLRFRGDGRGDGFNPQVTAGTGDGDQSSMSASSAGSVGDGGLSSGGRR